MAGFTDFYSPPTGTPLGFTLGDLAAKRNDLTVNHGLDSFEMGRQFDRGTQDIGNQFSAQGAARSSAKNQSLGRLGEDYTWSAGRSQVNLTQALSDLDRQRRLATFGVLY